MMTKWRLRVAISTEWRRESRVVVVILKSAVELFL